MDLQLHTLCTTAGTVYSTTGRNSNYAAAADPLTPAVIFKITKSVSFTCARTCCENALRLYRVRETISADSFLSWRRHVRFLLLADVLIKKEGTCCMHLVLFKGRQLLFYFLFYFLKKSIPCVFQTAVWVFTDVAWIPRIPDSVRSVQMFPTGESRVAAI